MQIEKHLYRISERALKSSKAGHYWTILFGFFLFASAVFVGLFLTAQFYILPNNDDLSKCFQKSIGEQIASPIKTPQSTSGSPQQGASAEPTKKFEVETDAIYLLYSRQFSAARMEKFKENNQIAIQNSQCYLIENVDTRLISETPLELTFTPNILYLDSADRKLFNFKNYTVILKGLPTLENYVFSMHTLIANELVYDPLNVFPPNPYVKSQTVDIRNPLPEPLTLKGKLYVIAKSVLYYFIVSVATSLYIYGTILAAPAVIILFLRCSSFARNGNMADVYKVFPWIGMHSLIRETSENPIIKKSSRNICWAIILYFLFLYFIYYALVIKVSGDLFYQNTEKGLEQVLFGFVAMVEFCSIVFMRTRPFLRYYPVTHTLLMVLFLVYCQICPFGFKKLLCSALTLSSATLFAFMVCKLEIPAQTEWNRAHKYTPTVDRPRIGVLPLFNVAWANNLPEEWTLVFPLFGRENFTTRQMSFVDRNFEELNQLLNGAPENVNPNPNQELEMAQIEHVGPLQQH